MTPRGERAVTLLRGEIAAKPLRLREHVDHAMIRAFDISVAFVLLTLLFPVIVLAAVLVRLDSPGPSFFRCRRVGYRGRPLSMLKFRKMHHNATGLALTTSEDQRFTRIGALLSKLKLDELPQLWHVLVGDMSLVGPRPEDHEFVQLHFEAYEYILSVRPGITGLSQVAFAEESSILDFRDPRRHYVKRILPQKVALDKMYANRRTLGFNLRILFWTISAVLLRRKIAVHRESGKMNLRRR